MKRKGSVFLCAVLSLSSAGCQKYKDKSELQKVAPVMSAYQSSFRDIDHNLQTHTDQARAVAADAGGPFEAASGFRVVVTDHQEAQKTVERFAKAIDPTKNGYSLHEISAVYLAADAYAFDARCASPARVKMFGLPEEKDCLPKCEASWGKLVRAMTELRDHARTFEVDIPAIR
jgi:hypothetical protein